MIELLMKRMLGKTSEIPKPPPLCPLPASLHATSPWLWDTSQDPPPPRQPAVLRICPWESLGTSLHKGFCSFENVRRTSRKSGALCVRAYWDAGETEPIPVGSPHCRLTPYSTRGASHFPFSALLANSTLTDLYSTGKLDFKVPQGVLQEGSQPNRKIILQYQ